VFIIYYFFNVNLETALLVPSGAAILVYVIGCASGLRIAWKEEITRKSRKLIVLSAVSLAISLIVLPFVGWLISFSLIVGISALVYSWRVGKQKQRYQV